MPLHFGTNSSTACALLIDPGPSTTVGPKVAINPASVQ